eukprot:g2566.t1
MSKRNRLSNAVTRKRNPYNWQQRRNLFGFFTNKLSASSEKLEDHWELDVELGSGRYGIVRRAWKVGEPRDQSYAVKTVPKNRVGNMDVLRNEIKLLSTLDHPNIVKFISMYEDNRHLHIVTPEYSGGELFDRIVNQGEGTFSEKQAAIYVKSILEAINYCHSNKIAHRDIKPENLILKEPNSEELVLIDFGMSRIYDDEEVFTSQCGSPSYVAPEVLKGAYTQSCDLWSIGVITYILMTGEPPFIGDSDQETMSKVRDGKYEMNQAEWDYVSDSAKDLVKKLMCTDVNQRLTAEQALSHPWIVSLGEGRVSPLPSSSLASLKEYNRHRKLKREVLQIMSSKFTSLEIEEIQKCFTDLDKDGKGFITVEDLRNTLEKANVQGMTGMQSSSLDGFLADKSVDVDGDGMVDYNEFIAATLSRHLYLQEEKLYAAFEYFDTNGDGKISPDELKAALGENADIEELLKGVDTDGDGMVDYNEFIEMMRS